MNNKELINKLSEREKDILKLLIEGLSDKVIALKLDIPVYDVKFALKQVYSKLALGNRTQAAMWALANLISIPPPLKEYCDNCGYFRNNSCVFYPPRVVNTAYIGSGGGNITVWPEVKPEEWCGKWESEI